MDGIGSSSGVVQTPKKARDVKHKMKKPKKACDVKHKMKKPQKACEVKHKMKKREARLHDVKKLANLLFLFLQFINCENRLCRSERFQFALIELKRDAVLIR